jgi:predicted RNase H-like HicB family nuclease
MSHYTITIWWNEADDLFVAEAPELPGCIAHGSTQNEALANIREAIEVWLEIARQAGDPIPQPKRPHLDA